MNIIEKCFSQHAWVNGEIALTEYGVKGYLYVAIAVFVLSLIIHIVKLVNDYHDPDFMDIVAILILSFSIAWFWPLVVPVASLIVTIHILIIFIRYKFR